MKKKTYQIISGGVYEVEADSAEEALNKYYAYDRGESCSCEEADCQCVGFIEVNTILMNADLESCEA